MAHAGGRRHWSWVETEPGEEASFSRTPDRVEHEADFEAMSYVRTLWFSNPEIWAESETSWASEHYEIERAPTGWMVRLVGRNHSRFEVAHAWEPASPMLAKAWDRASKGA